MEPASTEKKTPGLSLGTGAGQMRYIVSRSRHRGYMRRDSGETVRAVRAGLRDAWPATWGEAVRVVLGGLGRLTGLPQLRLRRGVKKSIGRTDGGWQGIFVRDMACATLSAGESERMLESTGDELTTVEAWLMAISDLDPQLAITLDQEPLSVTMHLYDSFLQVLCEPDLATRLLQDPIAQSYMEMSAKLLAADMEVHITWPVK